MLLEIDCPCCPLVKRLQQIPFFQPNVSTQPDIPSPQPLYLLHTNTSISVGELQLCAYSQRSPTPLFVTWVATETIAETI